MIREKMFSRNMVRRKRQYRISWHKQKKIVRKLLICCKCRNKKTLLKRAQL